MKTYIYGAGQYGNVLYKIISKYEKIDGFIDKYKTGKNIISIDKIQKSNKIYNSVMTYEKEVLKELPNIITFKDTITKYPEILQEFKKEQYLWMGGKLLDEKLKIVREFFSDKISLEYFDKWCKFREKLEAHYFLEATHSLEEQYFIDEFKNAKRFVDCGGYIGDTIENYYRFNDGEVISFEPDPKNLEKLNKVSKNKKTLVYPMGVYSKTTILKFQTKGSGGNISDDGDILIPVTSLDETIYNFQPDYIKMDIEGAEKEALIGAKNIIKDFSPNLAISIYHKAEDLWEIPLLVKEINPNYIFKIRAHNHMGLETILYCKVQK